MSNPEINTTRHEGHSGHNIYYEIGFHIPDGMTSSRAVSVSVEKPNILNKDFRVELNWSAFGSVTIDDAEAFAAALQQAIMIAKKERDAFNKGHATATCQKSWHRATETMYEACPGCGEEWKAV